MLFALPVRTRTSVLSGLLAAVALLGAPLNARAQETYIALGDSFAFGYTTSDAPPSNGDQGYASLLRGIFDSRNGAASVDLVNLAIPGETTSSFFSGTTVLVPNADPNLVIRDGVLRNRAFNTNYDATPGTFQAQKFADQVGLLNGQGRQVDYLSLQLGGNDLLGLFVQPGFNALSPTDQFSLLINRLETLDANLTQALTNINSLAPNADVAVIGYADSFAGLGAFNPFPTINFNPFGAFGRVTVNAPIRLSTLLTLEANVRIAEGAGENGARYVDIYTPFLGNETAFTRILTQDPPGSGIPNFHPTPQGYSVIANAVAAPEPASAALLLLAVLPIAGTVARRRK